MEPLVTGERADRAREAIDAIAAALRDPDAAIATDPGLGSPDVGRGAAGLAVLFAELGEGDAALAWLDRALDGAAEHQPNALLYPGTVGIGWALAYLEGGLVDPDPDDNDVDELVDIAVTRNWPSADLIRGVTGAGVYLLERGRDTARAAQRLAEMATTTDKGTTWWVDPATCLPERAEAYPEGYYDVGIAHGQAGTVAFLAHAVAAGDETARPLLEQAAEWLLAHRLPDGTGPGRYPSIVPHDDRPYFGSRLAWCYGDPGVAVALLAAGRALGDDRLLKEGYDLAVDAAGRRGEDGGVRDAPLCHGSAGLVQIFRRLHEQTGDERVADAARHWFDVALAQRRAGEPVAGYGSIRPGNDFEYEPLAGFLEGAAGVALALHSAVTGQDNGWDSLLLTKPVA